MRRKLIIIAILYCFILVGCSKKEKNIETDDKKVSNVGETTELEEEDTLASVDVVNYNDYFNGVNGCMVLYNTENNSYSYYNEQLCNKRVSPCSTFKIISVLIGLKHKIIESENSTIGYDGTTYPLEEWNRDLTLKEAFSSSCIWYFKKILEEAGKETVEEELNLLDYGNCNISEWEGSNINSLPQLNGFWLESSLRISPFEQVKILANIAEGKEDYDYKEKELEVLKNIMFIEKKEGTKIYGKTGTGVEGHAWFVGFAEKKETNYYFAVYLDDNTKEEVSGELAKNIAVSIIIDN